MYYIMIYSLPSVMLPTDFFLQYFSPRRLLLTHQKKGYHKILSRLQICNIDFGDRESSLPIRLQSLATAIS